jgi:glycosyltransferase involved in cell wall biosynthesis
MKILILCYEYPPVGGGGGRVAASVAEGLATRGHEVKVVSAGLRHLARRAVAAGVEVHRPESFRSREDTCSVPEMSLYLATAFFPAWRLCRRWKPDVIHAHFVVPTGALALALHWITGIPYVLTAHLGDVPGGVPEQTDCLFRVLGPFIRPIWKHTSAVTAVSGFVAALARKNCGTPATVILNGVSMLPRPATIALGTPPRIVLLGRLSVQKNPLLAIRSLALLHDIPWQLEIIGEGPLADDVRQLIETYTLSTRVTCSGWLDAPTVSQRLASSDILLMTSTSEGLPMAAIEAMRHGLAIVGSRIEGLSDVISEGQNGLFCDLTPESFSAALRGLLESPDRLRAMRLASLDKVSEFNLPDRVADYERVLQAAAKC